MELEEKLIQATSKTFAKFSEQLAKIDPVAALLVTGAAIVPVMGGAFYSEYLTMQEIYRSAGPQALDAYNALAPKGVAELVTKGMADELASTAQNIIGKSTLAILTLPLTACLATLTAGKFQSLKEEIKVLEQGGRNIDPRMIKRVEYPIRDTCATRTTNAERFDKSFDALSRKIEEIQNSEAAHAQRAPGPKL
ncbi:hypothetical protein [Stutzerimonas stutzeri]|uniref:hypothetical protein n=1 Tax=Stutzerimonas stutzeri TaxID=316 RepID=UPI0015E3BB91|nr:hypothetical protein [Stutzerimonas stutzeri]MBA1280319.1 hypothetical protein [Stutzerimonas stutzeri]